MSWTYKQSTGELYDPTGQMAAQGYSGHGEGLNNPEAQAQHDIGPIPQGQWLIGAPVVGPSPYSLPLQPSSETMACGRSGFFIHGDSIHLVGQEQASHGCIVMPRLVRELVWESSDHELQVIA